jgi:hypothetical protein
MRLFALLFIGAIFTASTGYAADVCDLGLYRSGDGTNVIVTNRADPGQPANYGFTLLDGRRGSIDANSLVRCTTTGAAMRSSDGSYAELSKVSLTETPTHFNSLGASLYGRLIEPADNHNTRPLVIFVHGSENTSDMGLSYPYIFAAQGISVFMYDKRGTGSSEGFYTQNFELLAEDAVAASREARRMAQGRFGRWGYFGGSQGGWVAPRAAQIGGADFVAVAFGLVLSPLEEDREQVFDEMRRRGYDERTIAEARDVTDATGRLVSSHFTTGFEQLTAVKQRYARTPWLAQIEGEYTGPILRSDPADLRRTGAPRFDGLNIMWNYDASLVIRSLPMPQLWILAGSDRDAPGELTRTRLANFIAQGRPIDLYVFPHTDHGITEYTEAPNGDRTTTRVADGYYRLLGDWINARRLPPYGNAQHVGNGPG